MRGYLRIVPLAPRGSNGLYVRRESADRLESPLSGPGVQETGCGTAALRADIAAYARDERATGASCRVIAKQLGVSTESIRRWTVSTPLRNGHELVPVRVVTAATASLTVWSPTGYRVDGLSVPEAAELLRRLT